MSSEPILVDARLKHPFSMIVNGARGSGKSVFVKNLLQSEFIHPFPNKILWLYNSYQPELFNALKLNQFNIEFRNDLDEKYPENTLIVIDDFMESASNSKDILNLFVNGRHTKNSVVFLTQVLFFKSKYMRSFHLNTDYFVLLKTPRDRQQYKTLAQQIFIKDYEWFLNAVDTALGREFGHIFIDLGNTTPDLSRVQGNIFDNPNKITVYAPKKLYK